MKLILSLCIFFVGLVIWVDYTEPHYKIDLPEEIEQATPVDTLICIKKGNVLVIEFNNK